MDHKQNPRGAGICAYIYSNPHLVTQHPQFTVSYIFLPQKWQMWTTVLLYAARLAGWIPQQRSIATEDARAHHWHPSSRSPRGTMLGHPPSQRGITGPRYELHLPRLRKIPRCGKRLKDIHRPSPHLWWSWQCFWWELNRNQWKCMEMHEHLQPCLYPWCSKIPIALQVEVGQNLKHPRSFLFT